MTSVTMCEYTQVTAASAAWMLCAAALGARKVPQCKARERHFWGLWPSSERWGLLAPSCVPPRGVPQAPDVGRDPSDGHCRAKAGTRHPASGRWASLLTAPL